MSHTYKINNTNKSIMSNVKEIKYPYNGKAPNLIDKFLVLGYDQKTIDFTYKNCNIEPKEFIHSRFIFFEFEERPEVINEICNDYSKDLLDNDLILELIFPNYPIMYFLDKAYINTPKIIDEELSTDPYSIIFSINCQDNFCSKQSYIGFGFIFYILQEHKVDEKIDGYLYIPSAYVILSEYPYFYQFNKICKLILKEIKKENDEIPIDIIIYNIIKFLPSPINKSINLIFTNHIGVRQNSNFTIENILFNLESESEKDKGYFPSIFFTQLSGYPIIDINMNSIFNVISPEIIVEVFIFSFLEYDIIFYSYRPELLNMLMYIFKCFNYPFNDSDYYQYILSVSQESFMSGTSSFVEDKKSPKLRGILSVYDPDILTTNKISNHFVLDIDNKNFFFLYKEKNNEVEDIISLHNYIENIINYSSNLKYDEKHIFQDGIDLYGSITNLIEELIKRSKKGICFRYDFSSSFLQINRDENEKDCIETNKRLLKAFYIFIIQIIRNFMTFKDFDGDEDNDDNNSIPESRVPSFVINLKEEEKIKMEEDDRKTIDKKILAKKAGQVFRKKLMNSSKYNSFVIIFCRNHKVIDENKIPYTFINEFIYYSANISNNLMEVDMIGAIEQFYGKIKYLDFEEISKNKSESEFEFNRITNKINKKPIINEKMKKQIKNESEKSEEEKKIIFINFGKEDENLQNVYLFSFDNFSEYYQKNLRVIINREQEDDKENFSKVKSNNRMYKKYKRNNYFLSQKILNIYITYINNNLKEFLKIFNLIKCEYKKIEKSEINDINNNLSKNKNLLLDSKEIKNENLDHFYLIQNKLNKDRALKEKLFGTYDIIEILDIIEHNFIYKRFFSSFTLIKYSLLNILAITRAFKSDIVNNQIIMKIICSFCKITKLPSKKYMNIYLNIFQKMYQNKNLREKFKIKECIKIINLYFTNTNIPFEKTDKLLNEIEIDIEEEHNLLNSFSISESDAFKEFIKKKEIFILETKNLKMF